MSKLRLRKTSSPIEPRGLPEQTDPPTKPTNTLVVTPEGYALDQPDLREEDARNIGLNAEAGRSILTEIFAGTDLLLDEEKVSLILSVRAEVLDHWTKARNSFLSIGRALLALDEDTKLTEIEKHRLKRGSERIFPFSDAIASQLRQVARAVRAGRIPEELCPSAYSTAYHLTLLEDEELEEARRLNLVRPDVPRSDVLRFRRTLTERHLGQADRKARERLQARKTELEAEYARLKNRLEKTSQELREVSAKLKGGAIAID